MEYKPREPHGVAIHSDLYFTLMANSDGVGFVHCRDGVLVVPLTDDDYVLIAGEPSPAFGQEVLVLVGGEAEEGEPLKETANRELQEEIGYKAGQLDFLGELRPFSKYLTVRSFVYLARDLTPSRLEGDEDYEIRVERVSLAEFERLIAEGRLLDAQAIAALHMARSFLKESIE